MSIFEPRLTVPSVGNIYYTKVGYGGVNECIIGSPEAWTGSVLSNCVGYAWGRAYELLGTRPNLSLNDACRWFAYNKDNNIYPYSNKPTLGAIICWYNNSHPDSGGHVAVVEEIIGDTIKTSNSAYNSTTFYTSTITPNNGDYSTNGYTFQGFINIPYSFNPTPNPDPNPQPTKKKSIYEKNIWLYASKRILNRW